MNDKLRQCDSIPAHPTKNRSAFVEGLVSGIWIVPAVAAFIVVLFLVLGRARISETGIRFFGALVYSAMIGFPSAMLLNWFGFRHADRLGRMAVAWYALILLLTATVGSLAAGVVYQIMGILPRSRFWGEFHDSYPFAIVITEVVGLSASLYETMRHRLQDATLELRTRQVEQERANKLLAEAQLSSLESRIHPHFLFNTLNSIASLIPSDPKRAEDTVGKLASLLRFSISANQTSLVPLSQELKIVRDYLEIESTRFGARLRYQILIPDALGDVRVPPLALQTLVENSVKHVVSQRNEPSSITITGAMVDSSIELTVNDDGPGFSLANVESDHGLGNLVARLELLFGESAQFNVSRVDNKTEVTMKIPAGITK
jgi:sensor histidine kinase YesM